MSGHLFIFTPGVWIGEGRVCFSTSPDRLHFYTKWVAKEEDSGIFSLQQKVEMQGVSDSVENHFSLRDVTDHDFKVSLENSIVGKVEGTGVIDPRTISWEFRGHENFDGFEVFELQEGGDYMFHAEYASLDQFRTIIDGRIWKKE